MLLPTNQVNIPQSDMITQNIVISDKNNNLNKIKIQLLQNDEVLDENSTNSPDNYDLILNNSDLKIELQNNTLTITALKYNPTPYTLRITATDTEDASTSRELTIYTEKLDPEIINSLIPVKIVNLDNCQEQYNYTNDNLSNFKLEYNPNDDSINFINFTYNNHDFTDITMNYYSSDAMYGGKDNSYGAAIKLGIKEEGQFSNGKLLCIAPESNTSNMTCWALATPQQAENIKETCSNAVYSNQ